MRKLFWLKVRNCSGHITLARRLTRIIPRISRYQPEITVHRWRARAQGGKFFTNPIRRWCTHFWGLTGIREHCCDNCHPEGGLTDARAEQKAVNIIPKSPARACEIMQPTKHGCLHIIWLCTAGLAEKPRRSRLSLSAAAASLPAQAGSRFVCTAAAFEGPPASLPTKQGNNTFRQVTTAAKISGTAWVFSQPVYRYLRCACSGTWLHLC